MKNEQFLLQTAHNLSTRKKVLRVLFTLTGICALMIIISLIFWKSHTYTAYSIKTGTAITAGWPNNLLTLGFWGAAAFVMFSLLYWFAVDTKMPALAVNENGIFINQAFMRNNFIAWTLIKSIENVGDEKNPVLRILFKNPAEVLKNQFFLYRSIAKSSVEQDIFRIEQKENNGDLLPLYKYAKEKVIL